MFRIMGQYDKSKNVVDMQNYILNTLEKVYPSYDWYVEVRDKAGDAKSSVAS